MISLSDILHGKVLIVDDKEANVLMLDRTLRGAIDVKGKGRNPTIYAGWLQPALRTPPNRAFRGK